MSFPQNVFKEILSFPQNVSDKNMLFPQNVSCSPGCLSLKIPVLLLPTLLEAFNYSHKNIGWEQTFSDRVILSGGGFTLVFCELALFLLIG